MIFKHKSKMSNISKYFFFLVSGTIQLNIGYLFAHSSISKDPVYHKSFVGTEFQYPKVLFNP